MTQIPSQFESSYYNYRDAIDRDHARPFNKEFYFKKGTPTELVWDTAVTEYGNSPPVLGGIASVPKLQAEEIKRLKIVEYSEADEASVDYSDIGRKKRDTVYYLEKREGGQWKLPVTEIEGEEFLHESVERLGKEIGLEHFVIGRMCAAHNDSTFYLKSRLWNKVKSAAQEGVSGGFFTKEELVNLELVDEAILSVIN